jgi:hypothetical protein
MQLTVFRQSDRNNNTVNFRWRRRPTTCHQRDAAFEYCINIQPTRKPWNKQWVRVQNERDDQMLAWLRERLGDAAIVAAAPACTRGDSKPYLSVICRQLGLSVPRLMSHYVSTDAAGERHLAAIYEILRLHSPDAHAARRFEFALEGLARSERFCGTTCSDNYLLVGRQLNSSVWTVAAAQPNWLHA